MPDVGFVSLADSLGSLTSLVFFIFLGALLLILWQVAIMLGALIASIWRRHAAKEGRHVQAG